MPSTSQVIVEWRKETDEELPPGWTKIMKCKKIGDKIRKDPYYIDPTTGYIFRSRKDVFRYLSTGEIGRLAFKPKKGCFGDFEVDEKISPPTTAKRQKVEYSTIKKCPFTAQSSNSNEMMTENEKILEPSVKKEIIPVSDYALVQSDECAESLTTPKSESKEMLGRELRSGRLVKALPAPVASSEKQLQKQLEEGVEQSGNKRTQLKSSKYKDTRELSFPRRASKRLAGISSEPVPALAIDGEKSHVAPDLKANPVKEEKTSNSTDQVLEQVDQLDSASEIKSTIIAIESGEVTPQCENEHENSLLKGGGSLLVEEQPIKCEADSGSHGTEQKANETPETPLMFPFWDSLPDPCLEFAFKTLTGAIPVEDNLVIEDYFQQQLGSSVQTQNNCDLVLQETGGVDGFYQTSDLFRFDALETPPPPPPPQLQKNPALPASGNVNMISFRDNGLQQPSRKNDDDFQRQGPGVNSRASGQVGIELGSVVFFST